MSELKVASCFEFEKVLSGKSNKLFYSKSEVDKVIVEKDTKIIQLEALIENYNRISREIIDNANHQKYKQCLAMARWCHNQREIYERDSYNWELEAAAVNSLRNKANIMRKWHKRWQELAEKFKVAK